MANRASRHANFRSPSARLAYHRDTCGFSTHGRFVEGMLIGLGTYTVLFGAIPSRAHRAKVMTATGLGLIAAVCGECWLRRR